MNLARSTVVASLLAVTACSSTHELAVADGPVFALNSDHWQATKQDLTLIKTAAGDVPAAAPVPAANPVMLTPAGPRS